MEINGTGRRFTGQRGKQHVFIYWALIHNDVELRTRRKLEQQRHKNKQRSDDFSPNTLSRTTELSELLHGPSEPVLCGGNRQSHCNTLLSKYRNVYTVNVINIIKKTFFVNTVYCCKCSVVETEYSRTTNRTEHAAHCRTGSLYSAQHSSVVFSQ